MKHKSRHSWVLVMLLFVSASACAQDNEFHHAQHAIGFSGGGVIGTGISYRTYLSRSYFQGAFFSRVNSLDNLADLMIGASYGRVLSEISIVKALPPTALIFVSGIDGRYSKNQFVDRVVSEETYTEKSFRTGAGVALDIGNPFTPGLLFSIGTTYALSMERVNGGWDWNIGPQVNIGLFYNW